MTGPLAVDTSVVIPSLVTTHEAHQAARRVLDDDPAIPAHVAVEAYSVLTRLPLPLRVRGPVAVDLLARTFPVVLTMREETQSRLVATLAAAGVRAGAVYDGVVGLTALEAGTLLCTRDRRARPTYEALGVNLRWLG
ncbi:MAG: PIN domain-containing protein [Acidimicrobiales bacterium]